MGKDISYRNPSGLPDPTAHDALRNIKMDTTNVDTRVQAFIRAIKILADQSGYELLARIEIRDKETRRVYR